MLSNDSVMSQQEPENSMYPDICENMVVGDMTIDQMIGDGPTNNSYLFNAHSPEGHKYVLKCIIKSAEGNKNSREIDCIRSFNRPNLMKCEDNPFETKYFGYYFMEYADGGDLFSLVNENINSGLTLPEKYAKTYVIQMAEAIFSLHSMNLVHGDIKLDNFLLFYDKKYTPINYRVVLADFGYTQPDPIVITDNIIKGTNLYFAPEMMKCQQYGCSIDVWAFGVCVYILLTSSKPFIDESGQINMLNMVSNLKSVNVSNEAVDLICKCLVENPNERITMKDVKSHAWFTKDVSIVPTPEIRYLPTENNDEIAE